MLIPRPGTRLLAACLLLASLTLAQRVTLESPPRPASANAAAPQEKDRTNDPYARLDSFVGARLRLATDSPSKDDKDASGATKEKGDPPSPAAQVVHLIVDAANGSIEFAAITTGDWLGSPPRQIVVPMSAIQLDRASTGQEMDSRPALILSATRERLATLPAFDDATIAKRGLPDIVQDARDAWERPAKANAEEDGARPASASLSKAAAELPRWVMGERVRSLPAAASDEKLGSITECLVDNECRRLRFFVVTTKDASLLVPFSAFRLTNQSDHLTWLLDLPCKQIHENGVEYKKPERGLIDLGAATKALGAYRRSDTTAHGDRDQKR